MALVIRSSRGERFRLPLTRPHPCARLPSARRGGGMVDAAVSKTLPLLIAFPTHPQQRPLSSSGVIT